MKSAATYAGDPRHHHNDLAELREQLDESQRRLTDLERRHRRLVRRADRLAEALRSLNPLAIALIGWDIEREEGDW